MLLLRPKRSVALSTPTQPTLLPQLELAIDFGAPLDFGPGPAKPAPRRDSNAASVRVTTQRSAAPVLPSIPVSAPLAMPTTPTTPRTPVSAHSRAATSPATTTTHERTPSLSSASSSSNYSNTPTTPNTSVTSSPGGTSPKTRSAVPLSPTHVLDERHLARALTGRRRSPPAVHVRRDSVLTARRDSTISNVKRGRPTSPITPTSPYALPPSPRGRSLGARTSSAAASLFARTRARSTATTNHAPPTLAPVPALPPLPPKSLLRDSKKRYSSTPPTSPKKQRDSKRDSTMRRILSSLAPPPDAERERKEDESFYAPDADAQVEEEEFELLCAPTDISLAAPNGAKLRRVEKRTVLLVHLPSAAFSVDACERVREFCEGYGEVSTMQAGRAGRVRVEFRDKGVYERVEAGRAQVEGVGVCRVGLERWRGGS